MTAHFDTGPLPVNAVQTFIAFQPAPLPTYRAPLHRFLLSLAISLVCFTVPVVGLVLVFGK